MLKGLFKLICLLALTSVGYADGGGVVPTTRTIIKNVRSIAVDGKGLRISDSRQFYNVMPSPSSSKEEQTQLIEQCLRLALLAKASNLSFIGVNLNLIPSTGSNPFASVGQEDVATIECIVE